MLGKSDSKEDFQPRTCSGKKPLKTGQEKEDIVFIDLDSDQFDVVEIIDCPEVVKQKLRGSSGPSRDRISTPQSVISIDDDDDDDDDDESDDDVFLPDIVVDGVGELDSDASSNKRFHTASSSVQHSGVVDVDACDVVEKDSVSERQESNKASVSNGKKRKEVFTSKTVERNCYGLCEDESDSDCSNIEFIKCSVSKRQESNKASVSRGKKCKEVFTPKAVERNCYGLCEDESDSDCSDIVFIKHFVSKRQESNKASASVSKRQESNKASASNGKKRKEVVTPKAVERNCYGLFEDESESDCSDIEVIKREQWEKVSAKRKFRVYYKHASSSGLEKNNYNNIDTKVEDRSKKHGKDPLYGPTSCKNVKENQSSFTGKDDIQHGEKTTREKVYPCPKSKNCNFCNGVTGPSGLDNGRGDEESEFKDATRHGERTTTEKVSACPNSENSNFCNGVTGPSGLDNGRGDEESEFKDATRNEERTTTEKVSACPNSENSNFCNGVSGPSGLDNEQGDDESKFKDATPHGERTTIEKVSACPNSENSDLCNGVTGSSGFEKEKFMSSNQDANDMQVVDDESPLNAHDMQVDNAESPLRSKNGNVSEGNSNGASFEKRHFNGPEFELRIQDADLTASNEKNIINQKEKLKETDLYKQAMEEEWASRQRQLQIQSEEAQKLRKRKKAESRRLQDIERRQKERVEQVRETDKKEEEYMNMKEQLRGEVLKKLNQLENECSDMTSLLRGLGINVGTSLRPLPNEVHAAYKRAMFKFHPDRASKTDLREHVEAEEKCKLISRMKEKFCNTSWH